MFWEQIGTESKIIDFAWQRVNVGAKRKDFRYAVSDAKYARIKEAQNKNKTPVKREETSDGSNLVPKISEVDSK